jgi:hypothetical protein
MVLLLVLGSLDSLCVLLLQVLLLQVLLLQVLVLLLQQPLIRTPARRRTAVQRRQHVASLLAHKQPAHRCAMEISATMGIGRGVRMRVSTMCVLA